MANPDNVRANKRKYSKTPKGILAYKKYRDLDKSSGKFKARWVVAYAKKMGRIFQKNTCAACLKETKTQFHHYISYNTNNHLDVVELCRPCHYEAHKDSEHEYFMAKSTDALPISMPGLQPRI